MTPLVGGCLIFFLILTTYSAPTLAKKRCKPFLKKLHSVQAMQRKGYSLKRGESLRAREDKARDKWWKCENSSLAKFNALYGSKKKKKAKKKKTASKKNTKSSSYNTKLSLASRSTKVNTPTFNQTSAIVIQSSFKGDKQSAWLTFYNKPVKCQRPKSMSVFAYCHENKRLQQSEFIKTYRE